MKGKRTWIKERKKDRGEQGKVGIEMKQIERERK